MINALVVCQCQWQLSTGMALSVIDQSCQTVTITDDVIQNHMSFENNNIQSPKKKKVYFKNFQPFFFKYPLKHQYLMESYIKLIPTIRSIQ